MADAERALAHVTEFHIEAVRKPCGERDARGLRAGDGIKRIRRKGRLEIIHRERGARPTPRRLADQEPAIDVDGARPTGGEDERLLPADADGAGLPQQLRHLLAGCGHGLISPIDHASGSSPRKMTTSSSPSTAREGATWLGRFISVSVPR